MADGGISKALTLTSTGEPFLRFFGYIDEEEEKVLVIS
jgi:hypothetical protein